MTDVAATAPAPLERSLARSALPGIAAGSAWGLFVGVPRAYLPTEMPTHAARRAPQVRQGIIEAATIAAVLTAINHSNHNGLLNDGQPNTRGQSAALAIAGTAPLFAWNTISSGNRTLGRFSGRMATGAAIAGAAGVVLHELNRPRG